MGPFAITQGTTTVIREMRPYDVYFGLRRVNIRVEQEWDGVAQAWLITDEGRRQIDALKADPPAGMEKTDEKIQEKQNELARLHDNPLIPPVLKKLILKELAALERIMFPKRRSVTGRQVINRIRKEWYGQSDW